MKCFSKSCSLKIRMYCKTALSLHFSGGAQSSLSSLEVTMICDDLSYALLQVNFTELCIVNMYTFLKLTNKYSLIITTTTTTMMMMIIIIIMFVFIFTPIPVTGVHVTLNVLCICKICP